MADYAIFTSPDFDPNDYANAVLAGEPYVPQSDSNANANTPAVSALKASKRSAFQPAKEDLSVAISKLDHSIEDVTKQIKNVVTTHHEQMLVKASGVNDLQGSLGTVRGGLDELDASLDKLRTKIRTPYHVLRASTARLEALHQASDAVRRTARFIVLARRLESQMSELRVLDAALDKTPAIASAAATSTTAAFITPLKTDLAPLAGDSPVSSPVAMTPTNSRPARPRHTRRESLASVVPLPPPPDAAERERAIAKAALSIAELVALLDASPEDDDTVAKLPSAGSIVAGAQDVAEDQTIAIGRAVSDPIPLRKVNAVAAHIAFVEESRKIITTAMEDMILAGLAGVNQSLLASSLQTAFNLRVLPKMVYDLVVDLSGAVEERIRVAFDLAHVAREMIAKEPPQAQGMLGAYKSRLRTEPTNLTAPQYATALWSRLEVMVEEMAGCCIKVYTLEKVLKLRRDPVSQILFMDDAMRTLENKPSATFWTSLSQALEKQARDATKGSAFLQQTLGTGYPKLLRLFHDFFAKIAVQTDTTYTQSFQSPETVLILRALSPLEALYLARVSNRLNEAVGQAFSGGARSPPAARDGVNVARSMANELDAAKFDPLLVKAVARNASASVDMMLTRADALIIRDRSTSTLAGPAATPQQISNASVATFLYHCRARLAQLRAEYPDSVSTLLEPGITNLRNIYEKIVDPLLAAVRRELAAIIARLHRLDLGDSMDPMGGMGGPSLYMRELVEKLSFIKTEILSKYDVPEDSRTWIITIIRDVMRTFVLHVSLAKPLGESGKLQLTSDMTELEFALGAFMVEKPQSKRGGNLESIVPAEYRTLRAMRPLLFLDNASLASAEKTAGLPPLVVLHHILVRSPIPLPHELHGWAESEYVRWVDEHSEEEALTLIEGGIAHWEKTEGDEGEEKAGVEYVKLVRDVLQNAKQST